MTPAPDRELVIVAAKASSPHFEYCDEGESWEDCADCCRAYDRAHYALAAALPTFALQVREQVAKEIGVRRDEVAAAEGATLGDERAIAGALGAYDSAARIARGAS